MYCTLQLNVIHTLPLPLTTQFELRHGCEPHENLQQFGWTRHDGNAFGQQQIVDDGIVLTTEFVKFP
ncbi:hypothetical protein SARC_00868, partial [Sphaeroforma arctica JP610]